MAPLYHRPDIYLPATKYQITLLVRIGKSQVKVGEFVQFELINFIKSSR